MAKVKQSIKSRVGLFTQIWGNEITDPAGLFHPPHRTLRSDITAAPFHARRIKTGLPFQVDS